MLLLHADRHKQGENLSLCGTISDSAAGFGILTAGHKEGGRGRAPLLLCDEKKPCYLLFNKFRPAARASLLRVFSKLAIEVSSYGCYGGP